MPIKGYTDYKRREFCRDIACSVQVALDSMEENSAEYEKTRKTCKTACIHTTYEFHHWLIDRNYSIVRPD